MSKRKQVRNVRNVLGVAVAALMSCMPLSGMAQTAPTAAQWSAIQAAGNKEGKVSATIGQNDAADQTKSNKATPDIWQGDKFYAVHGVTYDKKGNLLVTEFNQFGRLTKAKR